MPWAHFRIVVIGFAKRFKHAWFLARRRLLVTEEVVTEEIVKCDHGFFLDLLISEKSQQMRCRAEYYS